MPFRKLLISRLKVRFLHGSLQQTLGQLATEPATSPPSATELANFKRRFAYAKLLGSLGDASWVSPGSACAKPQASLANSAFACVTEVDHVLPEARNAKGNPSRQSDSIANRVVNCSLSSIPIPGIVE